MFKFLSEKAKKERFVEITTASQIASAAAADKITAFITDAEFKDPYPEFSVHKEDLEAARITEYELLWFIQNLNKENEEIEYRTTHPDDENGYADYSVIQFVWTRLLFNRPEIEPQKVTVVDA